MRHFRVSSTYNWSRRCTYTLRTSSDCLGLVTAGPRCPSVRRAGIVTRHSVAISELRGDRDIELVTQVSLDRWPRFTEQARAWGGPVSVAVYIPCPPDHPIASAYHDHLQTLAESLRNQLGADAAASTSEAVREAVQAATFPNTRQSPPASAAAQRSSASPRLTVSVLHSQRFAREGAMVLPGGIPPPPLAEKHLHRDEKDMHGGEEAYRHLYPINALRNVALRAASCSHVWLVDGDFIPNRGLRKALLVQAATAGTGTCENMSTSTSTTKGHSDRDGIDSEERNDSSSSSLLEMSDSCSRPVMWVVPAFELRANSRVNSRVTTAAEPSPSPLAAAASVVTVEEVPDSQMTDVPRTLEQLLACATASGRANGGGVTGSGQPDGLSSGSSPSRLSDTSGDGAAPSPLAELRPFHCGRYPQPLPSIDFERWWAASLCQEVGGVQSDEVASTSVDMNINPGSGLLRSGAGVDVSAASAASAAAPDDARWMTVPYHEYFEPYGIVRRDQVPLYDERFRGYGLNKVQHAYCMWAAGFEFRLLTKHFCITVPHARSVSYCAVFGTAADPQQRLHVERLYELFKQEMYNKYGVRYKAPS